MPFTREPGAGVDSMTTGLETFTEIGFRPGTDRYLWVARARNRPEPPRSRTSRVATACLLTKVLRSSTRSRAFVSDTRCTSICQTELHLSKGARLRSSCPMRRADATPARRFAAGVRISHRMARMKWNIAKAADKKGRSRRYADG